MSETIGNTFLVALENLQNAKPEDLVQQLMALYEEIRTMDKDAIIAITQTIRTVAALGVGAKSNAQLLEMFNACRVRMLELNSEVPFSWMALFGGNVLYSHFCEAFGKDIRDRAVYII